MENQHRQITGYRELTQTEIDLMNRIKAHAEETRALVAAVRDGVIPALKASHGTTVESSEELRQLIDDGKFLPGELVPGEAVYIGHEDGPWRWVRLADDHLQQGFMALTRAVAQPTSY